MLNDLDLYNKKLNNKIRKSLNKEIDNNNFIFGKSVKNLENKLSKLTNIKYVASVGSGTDALLLSLLCLNLKKNDQIIIPSFSWLSVLEVVLMLGLKPIYAETDLETFNQDLKSVKKLINKKTKVIISTSLFGRSADLIKLKEICKKKKIILIEDAAQNFGSKIKKKDSCSFADLTCTSFFPSKNLGCFGDGGAVFTKKKKFNNLKLILRNHGQKKYNDSTCVGINSRLGSLQAAVLIEKLKDFKSKKKKQKSIYKKYSEFFQKNNIKGFPLERDSNKNFDDMNNQFSMIVKKRASLIKEFNKYNIKFKIYYSKPLYKQFKIKNKIYLKKTEYLCKNIISLPFNDISSKRSKKVLANLQKIIDNNRSIFFEKN